MVFLFNFSYNKNYGSSINFHILLRISIVNQNLPISFIVYLKIRNKNRIHTEQIQNTCKTKRLTSLTEKFTAEFEINRRKTSVIAPYTSASFIPRDH